jgi:uncharacterized protein YndB with AHSA1/START domain
MTKSERPRAVHVVFIRAPAERVWQALTSSELSQKFFFARRLESDWRVGSRWTAYLPGGERVDTTGVVLESEPPRRLVVTWHVQWLEEARALGEAIVSYDIEPAGESVVKLTVTEQIPPDTPQKYLEGGRQGWAAILSSLKSLMETGEALAIHLAPPQ